MHACRMLKKHQSIYRLPKSSLNKFFMGNFCLHRCEFNSEYGLNLFHIALNINNGQCETFICKHCNNRGIYKDLKGKVFVATREDDQIQLLPVDIEQLLPSE